MNPPKPSRSNPVSRFLTGMYDTEFKNRRWWYRIIEYSELKAHVRITLYCLHCLPLDTLIVLCPSYVVEPNPVPSAGGKAAQHSAEWDSLCQNSLKLLISFGHWQLLQFLWSVFVLRKQATNQTLFILFYINYMLCCKQELVSQSGFYWEKQNYKEVNMWVVLDLPVWKTISWLCHSVLYKLRCSHPNEDCETYKQQTGKDVTDSSSVFIKMCW